MNRYLWLDMDGTIVMTYDVPNWLERLCAGDMGIFEEAKPRKNWERIKELLRALQEKGYVIDFCTWAPIGVKENSKKWEEVWIAKDNWIQQYMGELFPHRYFLNMLEYGTDKEEIFIGRPKKNCSYFLVDDNKEVRKQWRAHGSNFLTINASRSFVRELEKLLLA